jgi:hypothetical protein
MLSAIENESRRIKELLKPRERRQPLIKPVTPRQAHKMSQFFTGISQSIKAKNCVQMGHQQRMRSLSNHYESVSVKSRSVSPSPAMKVRKSASSVSLKSTSICNAPMPVIPERPLRKIRLKSRAKEYV